jgi:16S rRNA (cytosine967-C5)-methyltransferase
MGLGALKAQGGKAGLPARRAALAILADIFGEGRPFDDALMRAHTSDFEPRDRAFVTALVQTSLRRKGECEAVLDRFMSKRLPRKSGKTSLILLLSAAQLLYLGAPPHAVIDLAVTMAREDRESRHFSALINAVLRKLVGVEALDKPHLNVPQWLWRRWVKTYGKKTAHDIARAHLKMAPLDLTPKTDAQGWAEQLGGMALPTGSVRVAERQGAIETLAGFDAGAWWVQDAAAALPVKLLGDVTGKTVLDICAAPGGKTAQLAAAGGSVTAIDQSVARMGRVQENLDRLGLKAELCVTNALDFPLGPLFDAVLLDAPCSATGTIRRHPELPYIKSEIQIAELTDLQARLLAYAARFVKPGGSLVYCTCSLEPEEGERQVDSFLESHADFARRVLSPAEVGGEAQFITEKGDLRTLPSMNIGPDQGLDGFYATLLRRQ